MPANKRTRKTMSMPPYSRVAEHKYILKIVHAISSDIKDFHRDYIRGVNIDYQTCIDCLDKLLGDWEIDKSLFNTWKDYIEYQQQHTVDRKLQQSDTFKNLHFICDRTSHFEESIPENGQELMKCVYDHLYKYCVSFELETKGVEILSVQEYETDITNNRKNIDSKFDCIADSIKQFVNLTSPFYDFVTHGNQHQSLIDDICKTLLDICQIARSWIQQDKAYSDQIWEEMQIYQSNRMNSKDEERTLMKKREAIFKKIDQFEQLKKTATHNYRVHKRERNKLKMRIGVVEDKIERLANTLDRKKDAYNKTQEHRSLENPLTPRMQITYDNRLEHLMREVESLDGQVDPTKKHLEKLKSDLKEETDRAYEYKVEAATDDNEQFDLRKELPELDAELETIRESIVTNEYKLVVMQKIRSYIALADTLRRLCRDEELEKAQPELDNLNDALQMVSEHVGREWRKIYSRLPFIPPRDQWKKNRDIEILDMVAHRCDQTHEEQARKAFEKWLSFSRRGNIQQLIRTLRKVRKVELASQVEERYMVENVY